MHDKYRIFAGDEVYYVTFTIVEWINVLADDSYKYLEIDAIEYFEANKGLTVYVYCIMPNHVHMIVPAVGVYTISEILRDLRKFKSRAIVNLEQYILKGIWRF